MERLSLRKLFSRHKTILAAFFLALPSSAFADQYFDNVYADLFTGPLVGDVTGNVTGDVTGTASGNANLTLSNLGSTALNEDLVCATSMSCQLGSAAKPFGASYISSLLDGSSVDAIDVTGRYLYNGLGNSVLGWDSTYPEASGILLNGSSSGSLTLIPHASSVGDRTVTLPPDHCDAGETWIDDGSGNFSCGSAGGGGGAGINLAVVDTAANNWEPTQSNNFDFETSVGAWLAYADAAATSPVDMTGGSPGTTMARTTSVEINGAASGFMDLGTGSSRQGEGISLLVNIPTAYRGRVLEVKFPFVATGALVEDDLPLFVYDVTNSTLITPYTSGKILGASGIASAVFPVSTNTAQIRIGVHVARTATTALALTLDDFQISPYTVAKGMAGSDWGPSPYTFTPNSAAFGTISSPIWYSRWVGDVLEVKGVFTAGTFGATAATLTLPAGLAIDSSKLSSSAVGTTVGTFHSTHTGGSTTALFSADAGRLFYDGSSTDTIFWANTSGSSALTKSTGAAFAGANGVPVVLEFSIPIAGRSSNVSMAESSTYKISHFLANGTRVTGADPTKLGEWRSQIRNGSAQTFTDTNGNPTAQPSAADGIKIYGDNAWATGGTSSEPNLYKIFVGKNKNIKVQFYKSAGRTGFVDPVPQNVAATTAYGLMHHYDTNTGIFTIRPITNSSTTSGHHCGLDESFSNVTDCFFDIIVSENALAVGIDNNAPVSNAINERIERLKVTGNCAASPCTIASQSGSWASSVTRSGTGEYAVNFASGMFSAAPSCVITPIKVGATVMSTTAAAITASAFSFRIHDVSINLTDAGFEVICMGPK